MSAAYELLDEHGEIIQVLSIIGCDALTRPPAMLGQLRSLQELDFSYCSELTGLPESLG